MVVIDKKYAGAAVGTSVSGSMTAGSPGGGGTFTVADDTGYPLTGRFVVVIDRGTDLEEKILVASRSGTTFTVSARGYDGTSAQSHSASASCELAFDAVALNLVVDHVDDTEADPHSTKLLNDTRHDVEARHTFGGAYGTPATPTALTPDIAGSAGSGNNPAREDHVHNVPADVPVATGTALSEGAGSSFARNNHVHTIGAGSINSSSMFAAGVVDAAAIATDGVGTAEIAALAVGSAELAANAVIAGKVADGAVDTTAKLADGIVTLLKMASEASTDFTGTVDFCSGAFVLGTGGTQFAKYYKLGRIVFGWCGFVLGTGGNIVGNFELTLPVTSANNGARGFAAARARHDPDVPVAGVGTIVANTNLAVSFGTFGGASVWNATFPFNWDLNDSVECVFFYEAAS